MPDSIIPSSYPVTQRNKVKRVHERGRYDHASVHAILDAAMMCHISYVIDGQPYCTPTVFWREGTQVWWHGSSASRMLRAQKQGIPVCLTVAHLDSLVLARSGFHHSVDYRSAMCFGQAYIVEDMDEKQKALDVMINRFYPGRAAELRQNNKQELKATMVIGMEIENASGKVRDSGVKDDEEDYALPIYATRIPVTQIIGAAEDCYRMPKGVPVPPGLKGFTPGRRLDEIMTESYETIYGKHAND